MLEPFFNPLGIAVIGASDNPHKLGHGVVRNLNDYRYGGPIYPVNPTAGLTSAAGGAFATPSSPAAASAKLERPARRWKRS
jgi:acyl-CoA synthetase (NDP forming)